MVNHNVIDLCVVNRECGQSGRWSILTWSNGTLPKNLRCVKIVRSLLEDNNHVCINVHGFAKIYCQQNLCREGVCRSQGGTYSLSLHFCKPLSMGSIYKIRKILRFLVDCESSWIAIGRRDNPVQQDWLQRP